MDFSTQLTKVLDDLGKRFGVAIDWSKQNVAPYLQDLGNRYIHYKISCDTVWIVILALVAVLGVFMIWIEYYEYDEFDTLSFFGILIFLFAVGAITFNVFDIIKCRTIPEAVWFDYIKSYIWK